MTRPLWRIASPSSPLSSVRVSTRSPTPGISVGPRLARDMQADARRFAVRVAVPFGRNRDQLAVLIALGHVGEHDRGQGAGMMQLLAPPLDLAGVAKFAQRRLQRRAVVVLQPERARDLAHAGLALVRADEGEKLLAGGEGAGAARAFGRFFQDNWKLGPDRRDRQSGKNIILPQ